MRRFVYKLANANIKNLREQMNITKSEMSRLYITSYNTVNVWKSGTRKIQSTTLLLIAYTVFTDTNHILKKDEKTI